MSVTLYWLRQDLRLADNAAIQAVLERGTGVVPVYILDPSATHPWAPGGASRWWLHESLRALDDSLRRRGSRLILRRGDPASVLRDLGAETGAEAVVWNRCYEPAAIARDTAIKADLTARGIDVKSTNAALLFEPWAIRTKSGGPFRVYTPFWRACRDAASRIDKPQPAPDVIAAPPRWPASDRLDDWGLLPTKPDWAGGLRASWTPGAVGAQERLIRFLDHRLGRYADDRNRPDLDGTSSLSPHLHWGEIGPRQVWQAVIARLAAGGLDRREDQAEVFLQELVWREFSYHLLYHFPHLPDRPLDARFATFPWQRDDALTKAWQTGRTGYPIVDAGMRQLWHTGWMHNRVRMVVASFLVKHLLQPWQQGAAWFWDTLVDADLASNSASWQWVAGCGADAAPYFRIFNPVLQGERFDPEGDYVRRWVPELAAVGAPHIHQPWRAPAAALADAGVRLGTTYPRPVVDHKAARERALGAFEAVKQAA